MTRAVERELEHFIPIPRARIVDELCARDDLSEGERRAFAQFTRIVTQLTHYQFHHTRERLKDRYLPLAPEGDLLVERFDEPAVRQAREAEFLETLDRLLIQANYVHLEGEALDRIFSLPSPFRVQLKVSLKEYEVLKVYYRGQGEEVERTRSWRTFFRVNERRYAVFSRVALVVREKGEDRLLLKLFTDVPQAGLEMLMPRTRVSIAKSDRWQLLILVLSIAAGGFGVVQALLNGIKSVLFLALILGLWAFKVAVGIRVARDRFTAFLVKKLYYANLTNNLGVIHELIDLAEEEEVKETILAYYFLRQAGGRLDEQTLDERVEAYLFDTFGARCDFEVDDGVRKLVDLGLVETQGDTLVSVHPLEACRALDARWDGIFVGPGQT
ncbi:MAG: DUF3754 domain-containing protein [Bradymonadia bacterium]